MTNTIAISKDKKEIIRSALFNEYFKNQEGILVTDLLDKTKIIYEK